MDAGSFDRLTRSLRQGVTRRTLVLLLGGLGLGSSLFSRLDVAQAKKGGKKKGGGGKGNKKNDNNKNDRPHCGGGTFRCPTADGSGTHCVNLLDDVLNCGECDKQCGREGTVYNRCRNGICEQCPPATPNICTGGSEGPRCFNPNDPATCGGCTSAHVCKKDLDNPQRDFQCRNGVCVCTGTICENGRCCPDGFASCTGVGTGCCPTNHYACPNSQPVDCCPNGFNCGGTCGQDCCR